MFDSCIQSRYSSVCILQCKPEPFPGYCKLPEQALRAFHILHLLKPILASKQDTPARHEALAHAQLMAADLLLPTVAAVDAVQATVRLDEPM